MKLRITGLTMAMALSLGTIAGCNMVTGAGDLRIEPSDVASESGSGGATSSSSSSSSATGAGGGSSTTSTGSGNVGAGGSPMETPLAYVDGATVTDIDLYQAIRRPIAENGQLASSDIPVVAGKTAMIRVFYETDGAYNGQTVTARLTVGDGEPVEVDQALGGSSTHLDLSSTINFDVPGEILTAGSEFKVELLQPADSVSGSNTAAAFPSDGSTAPMGIEQGARTLKIMLVPVQNGGSLPDTSAEQVARYHRYFSEQYPVAEVEVTVRSSAFSYGGSLGSYNGWSNLLDSITDLRSDDNAPDDVYYYGIHDASGSGLLGLGWVGGSDDVWSRTAIGVGWTGDTAPETAVHELGHNHGRSHSPCGVSGDSNYPHNGARIGVWGYRPSDKQLLDPDDYVDFMSYCDPAWMSDYNFKKLFARAKHVSSQAAIFVPEHLQNRSYDRIKIIDGAAYLKDTITLARPPMGEAVTMAATVDSQSQTLTGSFHAYDHIDGGVLLVMRPVGLTSSPFQQATFSHLGASFTVTR